MESVGLHPYAVARTGAEARAGRSEQERAAAAAPGSARAAWRALLDAPPSAGRTEALENAYRLAYAAFERGDWELNTLMMHPRDYVFAPGDLEQVVPGLEGEQERPEGYLRAQELWLEAWTVASVELEALVELSQPATEGSHRLVALTRMHVRGRGSGLEIVQPMADVHTWRDGWLVRQEYWWDRASGLRTVGLGLAGGS